MFNYNNLVYDKKKYISQTTGNRHECFRIRSKYKSIEDLYDNISANLNIYIIAEQFNTISNSILFLYDGVSNLMRHLDMYPYDYVCFDSVKINIVIMRNIWIDKLSYIIENRICIDDEFFLRGNSYIKKNVFHNYALTYEDKILLNKTFTYNNSIIYVNEIKTKISKLCLLLSSYVKA